MKSTQIKKKLVLFDIDGTLIKSLRQGVAFQRFPKTIKKVFNLDVSNSPDNWAYNGMIDRQILWEQLKDSGLDKAIFLSALPKIMKTFCAFLSDFALSGPLYVAIEDAKKLAYHVKQSSIHESGVLTGNLESSGKWKLKHAGVGDIFDFGIWGHEAETRDKLAELVIPKAEKFFNLKFKQENIFIIGDTVHDIRCARHIGAKVIAVTTGYDKNKDDLLKENPDLLVDSLMDKRVLELLGLE